MVRIDFNCIERIVLGIESIRQLSISERERESLFDIAYYRNSSLSNAGNHDLGDKMNFLSVQRYQSEFGDTYFKFYLGNVLFIVLNSQLLFDANECTALLDEQNRWLDEILKNEAEQCQHVIVLQHHPLFTSDLDEKDSYFNLPTETRKALYAKLRAAGVRKVFTGHYHQNAIGQHEDFECIVTSAIGLQLGNVGGKFLTLKSVFNSN